MDMAEASFSVTVENNCIFCSERFVENVVPASAGHIDYAGEKAAPRWPKPKDRKRMTKAEHLADIERSVTTRRKNLGKTICSVNLDEQWHFASLLFDMKRNPGTLHSLDFVKSAMQRLQTALKRRFPSGGGLYFFELHREGADVHAHMLMAAGDGTSTAELRAWLAATWARIIGSSWARCVRVSKARNYHFSYSHKRIKLGREKLLVEHFDKKWTFGRWGWDNVKGETRKYDATAEQMEEIIKLIREKVESQAKFRPHGLVNDFHIRQLQSRCWLHLFMGPELRRAILAILEPPSMASAGVA